MGRPISEILKKLSFSSSSSDWFLRYKDHKRVHFRIFLNKNKYT